MNATNTEKALELAYEKIERLEGDKKKLFDAVNRGLRKVQNYTASIKSVLGPCRRKEKVSSIEEAEACECLPCIAWKVLQGVIRAEEAEKE